MRKEQALTQRQLAERMNISDKAVSKWERGLGCPDVSLLPDLSKIFGVNLQELLSGELNANDSAGGNMKKLKFYVCPSCGNLLTATADAAVSCCGKTLQPLIPQKAEESEKLSVEMIENDYFISSDHEMTREHYITFVALLTGDSPHAPQAIPGMEPADAHPLLFAWEATMVLHPAWAILSNGLEISTRV